MSPVVPPSAEVAAQARHWVDSLAKPVGALGRLEDVGIWLAACQGCCPPEPLRDIRVVVFAGDHGVAAHGVSAYPSAVTAAMVRLFHTGRAGVAVLARQHGVRLRVLDIAVDDDLVGLPADVGAHKIRRSSEPIHLSDALTVAQVRAAVGAGRAVAEQECGSGAQLLISGDMGIGNTTPSAALIAAMLGVPAEDVTGRGTGIDGAALAHKRDLIAQALSRMGDRRAAPLDPVDLLAGLGSADIAASAGFMARSADLGVPVLLDGVVSVAAAMVADLLAPGAARWFAAGHRSTEPAQSAALAKLGLEPLLDLGMRLGEGSGAVAAVPLVRSAVLILREMAQLADVVG
ncbi:MAG: nicotinate-nucleotide--dimethylbenzimidazole phosphoribosyltransferase [Nakamurella multipartita]